ncbi:hypothetical protein [uncultured Rummeliibacillus sp.]|uniref:hypothetical protein n=1 Tax=uncultured Rummeliibacillus sp. TaxID=762292 RepID=UPI00262AD54F|nr:hypothetical protein [uncultured Rummeliibacillus sp.]
MHPVKTIESTIDALAHPIETFDYLSTAIRDSYERDVINGDAKSRAEWFSYALGSVGLSVVGTKGLGAVSKTGMATTKVATKAGASKVKNATEKISNLNLLPYAPRNQLAYANVGVVPYNVVNGAGVKDQLLSLAKMETRSSKGTVNAKRPGGYIKGDVDEHGYLSPGVNRAPGNKNIASDNRIQSHHPIQNEWAKRWAKEGGFDYNEKKASAILLPSNSGQSHAIISSMQRKRRKNEGFNTDIRYEFNESYKEMIEAGVDQKIARKAMLDAYKYFDSLGGFVK